ncbi:hypothetical protein [Wenzhouxiangella sp. EGI_FJ10409]|uniref:hypothetical protein n=1 Tax=Wenzhouxiangella sp. EGI_FJ10409 TaxID=3243767 RepID=UPI0035DF0A4C
MALRVVVVLLALYSISAIAADPACEQGARSDDERFTEFVAVSHEFDYTEGEISDLVDQVLERFRLLWCDRAYGEGLKQATDEAVSIRLRAARRAVLHARADWTLARLRAVVEEALSRGLVDSGELSHLFTAYQAAGRYPAARRLRADFPDAGLPQVPEVVPAPAPRPDGARKVWHVDGEANRLSGDWLELESAKLLVVTSPGCSYCKVAVRELPVDEVLGPLVESHSVWLAERSKNNTFRSITHWNEHYPDSPTLLVDDPADWPIAEFDSTPQFHFVRDGEIVDTLVGWRGGPEGLKALADGFDRLGLLDASQLPDDVFAHADKPSYTRGCPERGEAWERIRESAAINTRNDLERHLDEIESGGESPLQMLSTEGRKRFLASMRFAEDDRLLGFAPGELQAQLEPPEIYELTSLFGKQYVYAGGLFDRDLLSEEEQHLNAMLNCEV